MILKDGKFWDDKGNVVPIEHGNKEQIKILNQITEMSTEGFKPKVAIVKKVSMLFTCVCGALNDFNDFPDLDEDDNIQQITGSTDKCHCCGLEYKVFYDDDFDSLCLRLILNKKK